MMEEISPTQGGSVLLRQDAISRLVRVNHLAQGACLMGAKFNSIRKKLTSPVHSASLWEALPLRFV